MIAQEVTAVPTPISVQAGLAPPDTTQSSGFFGALLDIINPLQHIPIVSTVYRALTGDEISMPARMIGGTLYGGPIGFLAEAVNVVMEDVTGKDPGAYVYTAIFGDDDGPPAAAEPALGAKTGALVASQASERQIAWQGERVVPLAGRAADLNDTGNTGARHAIEVTGFAATARRQAFSVPEKSVLGKAAGETPRTARPTANLGAPTANLGAIDERMVASAPATWVAQALREAEALQKTVQEDDDPRADTRPAEAMPKPPAERPAPQPWIAAAMMEALRKYEALSADRATGEVTVP